MTPQELFNTAYLGVIGQGCLSLDGRICRMADVAREFNLEFPAHV